MSPKNTYGDEYVDWSLNLKSSTLEVNKSILDSLQKLKADKNAQDEHAFNSLFSSIRSQMVLIRWNSKDKTKFDMVNFNELLALCCTTFVDIVCVKQQCLEMESLSEFQRCLEFCCLFFPNSADHLEQYCDILLYAEHITSKNYALLICFIPKISSMLIQCSTDKFEVMTYLKLISLSVKLYHIFGRHDLVKKFKRIVKGINMPPSTALWFEKHQLHYPYSTTNELLITCKLDDCQKWLDIFASVELPAENVGKSTFTDHHHHLHTSDDDQINDQSDLDDEHLTLHITEDLTTCSSPQRNIIDPFLLQNSAEMILFDTKHINSPTSFQSVDVVQTPEIVSHVTDVEEQVELEHSNDCNVELSNHIANLSLPDVHLTLFDADVVATMDIQPMVVENNNDTERCHNSKSSFQRQSNETTFLPISCVAEEIGTNNNIQRPTIDDVNSTECSASINHCVVERKNDSNFDEIIDNDKPVEKTIITESRSSSSSSSIETLVENSTIENCRQTSTLNIIKQENIIDKIADDKFSCETNCHTDEQLPSPTFSNIENQESSNIFASPKISNDQSPTIHLRTLRSGKKLVCRSNTVKKSMTRLRSSIAKKRKSNEILNFNHRFNTNDDNLSIFNFLDSSDETSSSPVKSNRIDVDEKNVTNLSKRLVDIDSPSVVDAPRRYSTRLQVKKKLNLVL